ncbi:hypothetical protein GXP67_04025 [Rhodocytophaga rosea]|uniref:Uncharacterized protein n=1 Tax=Rhodocytophaga rosea TaxID=2704465 RepID=A0A6C0GDK9_9BACT|nr:DUF6624 domain-containing protein [Rhodocytophaga rosea]QHT65893.1 hypothetical protein GXP67_04025 [Rhodocytophaga rosea]
MIMKLSIGIIFFLCLLGTYSSFGQNYGQLQSQLEEIHDKDQKYRRTIPKEYGPNSKEIKELFKKIEVQDAANLSVVKHILDTYGWIGRDRIGSKANGALFLVIQHADLKTQEKYLPILRKAVKEGNAHPSELALLEDRVAIRQGKKQIYGSQIGQDTLTGKFYVLPLEDPDKVDIRRARMGLEPLNEYVKQWGIVWKSKPENPHIKEKLLCDKEVDLTKFTKVDLPNLDYKFSPVYLNNDKLVGFTLTINPSNFTSPTITCMDGKPVAETDYRYDTKKGMFIIKVYGVTGEEQLYPTTMIIDGKGYYFYSLTHSKWFLYKKLSMQESPKRL